jgi:hypothetical protein
MSDRRLAPRTRTSGLAARVRPGHRVHVIDISAGGALLEAPQAMRPGAGVEVQFERAEHRVRVSGIVVRCGVTSLDPHRGPTYRAAIAFDEAVDWAREQREHRTREGYGLPEARGDGPRSPHRSPK